MSAFGLVLEHSKSEIFHFSRRHNDTNSSLDLSQVNGPVLTPKPIWRYLGFFFDRRLTFKEHIRYYSTKAMTIVKAMGMLGNSTRGLIPSQRRNLYRTCVLPIATYGFCLWFFKNAPVKAQITLLSKMQRKAATWISGAFRTSPSGGLEALTGLIPIQLHLEKLRECGSLRTATLPPRHALSRNHTKESSIHPLALANFSPAQAKRLKSPLTSIVNTLDQLPETFSLCSDECRPGTRVMDLWSNRIHYHQCNRRDEEKVANHLRTLYEVCQKAAHDTSQVVCAADASVPTSSRWQAISVGACWVGGHQITSIKSPTGKVTALDTELFAIRLAISKATVTGCKDIIIFTGNIPAAKRAMDTSIHSGQEHSIAMSRLLRSHFIAYLEGSLHFWDCPSDAKWFIQARVHDDAVRTQYPVAEQMHISLDALSQRNSKTFLEE